MNLHTAEELDRLLQPMKGPNERFVIPCLPNEPILTAEYFLHGDDGNGQDLRRVFGYTLGHDGMPPQPESEGIRV